MLCWYFFVVFYVCVKTVIFCLLQVHIQIGILWPKTVNFCVCDIYVTFFVTDTYIKANRARHFVECVKLIFFCFCEFFVRVS